MQVAVKFSVANEVRGRVYYKKGRVYFKKKGRFVTKNRRVMTVE